jgi:hypothetical protein
MSFISVIVIYLDNGAENSCISSNFGFSSNVHLFMCFFLQCLIRCSEVECMANSFPMNTLMVSKNL